jgi:hypothetical protein
MTDPTQFRGAINILRSFLQGLQGDLVPAGAKLCFDTRGEGEDQTIAVFAPLHPTLAYLIGTAVTAVLPMKPLSFHEEGAEYAGLRESLLEALAEAEEQGIALPSAPFVLPDEFGLTVEAGAFGFVDGAESLEAINAALDSGGNEDAARGYFEEKLRRELEELLADAENLAALLDAMDEYAQPAEPVAPPSPPPPPPAPAPAPAPAPTA